ncbi:MAG: membrane protein insertase YidC [Chthoniobacteraceae bacterium]
MDKKGIIFTAIAVIVLVWSMYHDQQVLSKQVADRKAYELAHPSATPSASPSSSVAPATPASAVAATGLPAATEATPEKLQEVTTDYVRYVFTNHGGGIAKATLLKHLAENNANVVLNAKGDFPIGAVSLTPGVDATGDYDVTVDGRVVTCVRTTPEGLEITKTYTLPEKAGGAGDYEVKLTTTFTNKGTKELDWPAYYLYTGAAQEIHESDLAMYTTLDWLREGKLTNSDVSWFDEKRWPLVGIVRAPAQSTYTVSTDKISWLGVSSQYFTSIVAPKDAVGLGVWAQRYSLAADKPTLHGMEAALELPGFKLAPGQSSASEVSIYAGPKELGRLKQLPQNQKAIMNFGTFSIISEVLLNSMNALYGYLHNYALAIILLTIIIKSLLWFPQNKATQSMKKMQLLSPKMTELKEKYKDDPTRMNQEIMKLYKTYGVNPMSGCLPVLIQIPIFFGLYAMLRSAVELRNSHFLWNTDLSQPDTVFHLGDFPINILPLVMAGTMFWQMALTPKSGDPTQQRIMMFTPLIFIFVCYNYASALALYWTVQNAFTIVQLYVTRNQQPPVLQKITPPKK